MPRPVHRPKLESGIGELRHIRIDHRFRRQSLAEGIGHRHDAGAFGIHIITPFGHHCGDVSVVPISLRTELFGKLKQSAQGRLSTTFDVGSDRPARQCFGLDIKADERTAVSQRVPPQIDFAEFSTHRDNEIRLRQNLGTVRSSKVATKQARMSGGDNAFTCISREGGGIISVQHSARVDGYVPCTTAKYEERPFSPPDCIKCPFDLKLGVCRKRRLRSKAFSARLQNLDRNLDVFCPRTVQLQLVERAVNQPVSGL